METERKKKMLHLEIWRLCDQELIVYFFFSTGGGGYSRSLDTLCVFPYFKHYVFSIDAAFMVEKWDACTPKKVRFHGTLVVGEWESEFWRILAISGALAFPVFTRGRIWAHTGHGFTRGRIRAHTGHGFTRAESGLIQDRVSPGPESGRIQDTVSPGAESGPSNRRSYSKIETHEK